jgi:hypothetical protein
MVGAGQSLNMGGIICPKICLGFLVKQFVPLALFGLWWFEIARDWSRLTVC